MVAGQSEGNPVERSLVGIRTLAAAVQRRRRTSCIFSFPSQTGEVLKEEDVERQVNVTIHLFPSCCLRSRSTLVKGGMSSAATTSERAHDHKRDVNRIEEMKYLLPISKILIIRPKRLFEN